MSQTYQLYINSFVGGGGGGCGVNSRYSQMTTFFLYSFVRWGVMWNGGSRYMNNVLVLKA